MAKSCKYCSGSHGSADHAHSNSMKASVNAVAKRFADKSYKAEAHNRKAKALRERTK